MAQDHQRKNILERWSDKTFRQERPRSIPEELLHMLRECRAASRSQCKGPLRKDLNNVIWRPCRVHCKTNETRQCKTDGRQNKTVRDRRKAAQDRRNKPAQPWDPCLGCIECFGSARLRKTRQDKTRRTKHNTLHFAQPPRSPPRMHRMFQRSPPRMHGMLQRSSSRMYRMLRKCKAMEERTRQDRRNRTHYFSHNRRDPRLGCMECFRRARLWTTRQGKRNETRQCRTKIPASDASNASEIRA